MERLFKAEELTLPGVLLVRPRVFTDERGGSVSTYSLDEFKELGITSVFVQDYVSVSKRRVIRGLHFQRAPYAQDKLVRCSNGEIFDVVVDHDPSSKTFGSFVSVILSAREQDMLFIPGRYAHGFCVTSDEATTEYRMSAPYSPGHAGGVRWDDPAFNIPWPVQHPIVSGRDALWPHVLIAKGR